MRRSRFAAFSQKIEGPDGYFVMSASGASTYTNWKTLPLPFGSIPTTCCFSFVPALNIISPGFLGAGFRVEVDASPLVPLAASRFFVRIILCRHWHAKAQHPANHAKR